MGRRYGDGARFPGPDRPGDADTDRPASRAPRRLVERKAGPYRIPACRSRPVAARAGGDRRFARDRPGRGRSDGSGPGRPRCPAGFRTRLGQSDSRSAEAGTQLDYPSVRLVRPASLRSGRVLLTQGPGRPAGSAGAGGRGPGRSARGRERRAPGALPGRLCFGPFEARIRRLGPGLSLVVFGEKCRNRRRNRCSAGARHGCVAAGSGKAIRM